MTKRHLSLTWSYSAAGDRGRVLNAAGIYCVWAVAEPDPARAPASGPRHATLLYIGISDDVNRRLNGRHESESCWRGCLSPGEVLAFTQAPLVKNPAGPDAEAEAEAVERCLISIYLPPCNNRELTYVCDYDLMLVHSGDLMGVLNPYDRCFADER